MFDIVEIVKRIIKYIIQGIMVAICAFFLPKNSLNLEEIMLLGLSSAAIFSILDTYIPSMNVSAHQGVGLGLGLKLVGF
jgi:ABC-type Co2+ transport system permease subunit